MRTNVQTDGVIITAKQKAVIEKKISKLKKYLPQEPVLVEVTLSDETGPEKGGIDQTVRINTTIDKEKIIIEESDDRLMRAFAYALGRFERQLSRHHKRQVEASQGNGENRVDKLWRIIKRKDRNRIKKELE